jgi:type II secretory pathway pseudopilin PulG
MYTLQGLLVLAACIGITFYGFKRQQRQREKILAAENEKQQQALQMLTTAALAVENGNKATAEQLLQEANKLLREGKP